jgi:hypothetical protein
VSVNVIAEFVGGYIMTDKPLANVVRVLDLFVHSTRD